MLQFGSSLVRSQLVSLEFFIDIKSFRSHYGPGVDSACNRNEYQEYFLGGKGGLCLKLTNLQPSCAVVTKSGNLNFLENSGPVQACNGTDLLILLTCLLAYLLTHSTVHGPSWEANRLSASQEIPRILWNSKVHYRVYDSPPPAHILSQINSIQTPHPTPEVPL